MQDIHTLSSKAITERKAALSEAIIERLYYVRPELAARYGEQGRARCLEDTAYHLSYLSQSIAAARPALFADYVAWAKVMLAGRGVPSDDLLVNLECLREVLKEKLPAEAGAAAVGYVEAGIQQLPGSPSEVPSFIDSGAPLGELTRRYLDALLNGERYSAARMILDAVEGGASIKDIYLRVFEPSQREIGRLWQMNLISVAQEHYCTAATQLVMSQLYPHIFSFKGGGRRRTLLATSVAGELHEMGIRMVSDFFEMEGWDTFYLGANTPAPSIVRALVERRADLLAISATITSNVGAVAELIRQVRGAPGCSGVKILVGGYPFNKAPDLWERVGADAFAQDALQATQIAGGL